MANLNNFVMSRQRYKHALLIPTMAAYAAHSRKRVVPREKQKLRLAVNVNDLYVFLAAIGYVQVVRIFGQRYSFHSVRPERCPSNVLDLEAKHRLTGLAAVRKSQGLLNKVSVFVPAACFRGPTDLVLLACEFALR